MDDEALACCDLITKLPHKDGVHIIYATGGMKSPAPIIPARDKISPDLGKTRMQESIEAMKLLGVPEHNLHLLCLPEAQLRNTYPHYLMSSPLLKRGVTAQFGTLCVYVFRER